MIFLQLFLDCLVGFLVPDRLLMIYIIFQNLIDTEYKGEKIRSAKTFMCFWKN
jgi:hypothetical protein